jgi:hypothetical protein
MIAQIKTYAAGAIIIALLTAFGLTKLQLYYLTSEYKEYKESINAQLQTAINEKVRIESEQAAKLDKARRDYSTARRDLDSILDRLRNGEIVSRDEALQVAGNSPYSLSSTAGSARGTQVKLKTYAGTCDIEFYSDAMKDNLQCQSIIEFIK